MKPHSYHTSIAKLLVDYTTALLALIVLSPLILTISIIIFLQNHGPVFFRQKRVGKNGKIFTLIKFRTMKVGSEKVQSYYKNLNEADGPVFKIRKDPRFTKFGKLLAHSGLDELPQILNVLRGEMSLVGPRPLPVHESKRLTKAQKVRELVKPGITSSWVVEGSHTMKFSRWMKLDKAYILNSSATNDLAILTKTFLLILSAIFRQ